MKFPKSLVTVPLAALLSLSGCFSAGPISAELSGGQTDALGVFQLSAKDFDAHTIKPKDCTTGQYQSFFGADFIDDKAGVMVRLVVDPLQGGGIRVSDIKQGWDKGYAFTNADCDRLLFSINSTGLEVNDIDDIRVTLDIDCKLPTGETISGKASTTHCH